METGLLTTDQIRSWVIPLLEKYGMRSASLFGSYARDEADVSSDIDILLVGNPGFKPLNVFGVAEDRAKRLMCSGFPNSTPGHSAMLS